MEELYDKLNKNINELSSIENEISSINLEIYQREISNLKEDKIKELRQYLSNQAKIYKQKEQRFLSVIEENINIYEQQINKIIAAYDMLYIKVFSFMQNARNNQKIALANIVTVTSSDNIENNNLAIACVQKKINYSVIIDECKARLEWCLENIKKDINELFIIKTDKMIVYKENFWNKFMNIIINKLHGKSIFLNVLSNFKNIELKKIENSINVKILDIGAVLAGVTKQMNIAKNQIAIQYEESIKNIA